MSFRFHPGARPRPAGRAFVVGLLGLALALGWVLGDTAKGAAGSPAVAAQPGGAADAAASIAQQPGSGAGQGVAYWLPVLNFEGEDDVCRTWIETQNAGADFAKAILITWGGHAQPQCGSGSPSVSGVECSGLLRPGQSWSFIGAQLAVGSASGVIYSFKLERLSDLGVDPGYDDLVADYLCDKLQESETDPNAIVDFARAYGQGGVWAGVPMDRAQGARLAVTVLRNCPGDRTPGVDVSSSYAGLPAADLSSSPGVFDYAVGPIHRDDGGFDSMVYLQNAGLACASVSLFYQNSGACGSPRACGTVSIPPGQHRVFDPAACQAGADTGLLWVESSEPLAIVADTMGNDALLTQAASPVERDGTHEPVVEAGGPTLFGAVQYLDNAEAESVLRVFVQNLTGDRPAQVRVSYLDADGALLAFEEAQICDGGQQSFEHLTSSTEDLPVVGSLRVESLAMAPAAPARIAAVAELHQMKTEPQRHTLAYSLNLLPESQVSAWPPRSGSPGAALLAFPHLNDLWSTGVASGLVMANAVAEPGRTDFVVLTFDQNALFGLECGQLGPAEARYLDLAPSTAPVVRGFRGAAIVSATAWTHQAPAGAGSPGPVVGLTGLQILRSGSLAIEDIPGDEVAALAARALPRGALPLVGGGGGTRGALATSSSLAVHTSPNGIDGPAAAICPGGVLPPMPAPVPLPVPPGSDLAELHLPVGNNQGQDMVCQTQIRVTNTGNEPSQAILVGWTEPQFGPPNCSGPVGLLCSGLIAPGGEWITRLNGSSLIEATSAHIYSLSARTLAELGIDPGSSELAGDRVCAALTSAVIQDCEAQRIYELAFRLGGSYAGIPLARAYGAPLSAQVERECPGMVTPGVSVTSSYAAIPHREVIRAERGSDPANGAYAYAIPEAMADRAGANTITYIQNTGPQTSSVSLSFREHGSDEVWQCRVFWIAPSEAYPFDTSDCVGPDWIGSIVLRSSQALAIIVEDSIGDSYIVRGALTGLRPLDFNGDGLEDERDLAEIDDAMGATPGDPRWDPRLDLNFNNVIDHADRAMGERYLAVPPEPTPTPIPPDPTPSPEPTVKAILYLPISISPLPFAQH